MTHPDEQGAAVTQGDERDAERLVAAHCADWRWPDLEEGVSEHSLAVDACARGIAFARHREEATRQAGWQPIESAPRDGTLFLAAWRENGQVALSLVHWSVKQGAWLDGCEPSDRIPTQWQPLPPPPTGDAA